METVFPKNLDPVNRQNAGEAVSTLEDYIRYMRECIDFSMSVITKDMAAKAKRIEALEERVKRLENGV